MKEILDKPALQVLDSGWTRITFAQRSWAQIPPKFSKNIIPDEYIFSPSDEIDGITNRDRINNWWKNRKHKETLGTPVGGFGKPVHAFSGTVHYLPKIYKENHMKEQQKGKFQKIADEVVSILNRDRLARNLGFNRIYSSHDDGIHFDFASGGFTLTLDDPGNWEKLEPHEEGATFILDLMITGESPKEVDDIMEQQLYGKAYVGNRATAKQVAGDILDAAMDAHEHWRMEHPEYDTEEESMSQAKKILKDLDEVEGDWYVVQSDGSLNNVSAVEARKAWEKNAKLFDAFDC